MTLFVNEIFYSIQGESLFAGCPCVFIRLTGCNLRCRYCDTHYAYDEGRPMTIDDILRDISAFPSPMVEITGGEPLAQGETPDLVTALLDKGYRVLMETNGSLDIDRVDRRCIRIMDLKCPSSGESHQNDVLNLSRLTPRDQLKFVVSDKNDYRFAKKTLHDHHPPLEPDHILLSPVTGVLSPDELARWMLEDGSAFRLHLQLHKIIWPDKDRGV